MTIFPRNINNTRILETQGLIKVQHVVLPPKLKINTTNHSNRFKNSNSKFFNANKTNVCYSRSNFKNQVQNTITQTFHCRVIINPKSKNLSKIKK